MYYYLLLALLSINAWAMKRSTEEEDTLYSEIKSGVVKYQGEDIITFEELTYANSIMVRVGKFWRAYLVTFLYRWLCEENKDKIPGVEVEATAEQKAMIKLYYQALPLAKNMTETEINELIPWLFRLYLYEDSENIAAILYDLINNKLDVYQLILKKNFIDASAKLTDNGLLCLKRFLRKEHINKKHFPYFNDDGLTIQNKIRAELPKYNNGWTMRESASIDDDEEKLKYYIAFTCVPEEKIFQLQITYESGLGFYHTVGKNEKQYFTNLIDILERYFSFYKISKKNCFRKVKKEDPITHDKLGYSGTIMLKTREEDYTPYPVVFLYWLIEGEFTKIPGLKIEPTPEQIAMIKLYYQALPLAENMTEAEINELIPWLFKLYLHKDSEDITAILYDLINNKPDIYQLIVKKNFIDASAKLTDNGLLFLKRFLHKKNINTMRFSFFNDNSNTVNDKINAKLSEYNNGWTMRESASDGPETLAFTCVTKDNKIFHHRIRYEAGLGFSYGEKVHEKKHVILTNLIDILERYFSFYNIPKNNYFRER